jgi:hypothetical protein
MAQKACVAFERIRRVMSLASGYQIQSKTITRPERPLLNGGEGGAG